MQEKGISLDGIKAQLSADSAVNEESAKALQSHKESYIESIREKYGLDISASLAISNY